MKILNDSSTFEMLLKKYDIFSIFPSSLKERIELRYFEKNEFVFLQGYFLEGFFYQLEGRVKILCTLKSGSETNLRFFSGQRIYGGSEFFLGLSASASVQTMSSAYFLYIPFKSCQDQLMNDTRFLFYLGKNYAEVMHVSNNNFTMNQSLSHDSRVAAYIISISNGEIFPAGFKEIPGFLGISYRHLLRILNEFAGRELIVKEGKNYRILDIEALEELAGDVYM